jgi:uncharacterized secreted protein with C-terminal beta-propeller domain
MERSIRKRTILYGVSAVLMALILATLIYGYQPFISSSSRSGQNSELLATFPSLDALKNFLITNSTVHDPFSFYQGGLWAISTGITQYGELFPASVPSSSYSTYALTYSPTNIQVAGVDEADIVKADSLGYIYAISGTTVSIVKAYPATEAEVVSRINYSNQSSLIGLFVSGDRLTVLGSNSSTSVSSLYTSYNVEAKTFADVYDITDRSNPRLLNDFVITGNYFDSRMIGDYVYLVTGQPAYLVYDTVILPKIYINGQMTEIAPTEVHYVPGSDEYYQYTTFSALNMQNPAEAPTYNTVLMGQASNMYMSTENIYVTFQEDNTNTTIYRLHVKASNMTFEARGDVPGQVFDQFSMDEYNGTFRVATSTWKNGTKENNVYIMNMSLGIVGRLENLAPGENLHAARFVGDRGYLVTFINTDPLFVIDLSKPTSPTVLGQLNMSGYSDYIYPYDATHLIGVGKETTASDQGYFAWYQGIKISLFDVSNVTNPKLMANYTIGDRGSDSPVLTDPKAFLFDKSKDLLVIPVLVAKINQTQYPNGVPSYAYGDPVLQGAYVFNVTLQNGLVPVGNITHIESGMNVLNQSYWVQRSLYIENVLYTISDKEIKMNSLQDLSPINEISLP